MLSPMTTNSRSRLILRINPKTLGSSTSRQSSCTVLTGTCKAWIPFNLQAGAWAHCKFCCAANATPWVLLSIDYWVSGIGMAGPVLTSCCDWQIFLGACRLTSRRWCWRSSSTFSRWKWIWRCWRRSDTKCTAPPLLLRLGPRSPPHSAPATTAPCRIISSH